MALPNRPSGLTPLRTLDGSPWNQQANLYCIPSTDGVAYGVGSIVSLAAGADANGVPYVGTCAFNGTPVGVIVGVDPVLQSGVSLVGAALSLETIAIPAAKARAYYVYVVDDPSVIFSIQADNTTTLVASTCITANASPTIAAPAGASPFAATVLLSTSFAVTSTLMFNVIGMERLPGNDLTAYTRFLVKFNVHAMMGAFTAPAHL
jgi:hypothetical protein